jgi:hypothetical protein
MKSADDIKIEALYDNLLEEAKKAGAEITSESLVLKEEPDSLTQWNNQKMEEEKETYGDQGLQIKPVGDIFDTYEEVGMSAEMGLNDLITATIEDIVRQVPKESQTNARIAVKKMWLDIIKNWKSFEGYER